MGTLTLGSDIGNLYDFENVIIFWTYDCPAALKMNIYLVIFPDLFYGYLLKP